MNTAKHVRVKGSLVLLLQASFAHAQNDVDYARRQLLEEARAAQQANDHVRALEVAERAARLGESPSLLLFIATEQQALQQYARSFLTAFRCVQETTRAPTTLASRDVILQRCRALSEENRPRVSMVTIHPPSPAPAGLEVRVDGQAINPALYGIPYPFQPGSHVIEASAPARRSFSYTLRAQAGVREQLLLELPEADDSTRRASGPNRLGPALVLGAAGVGLVLGVSMFVAREVAAADCEIAGDELRCPDPQRAQNAPTYHAVSMVGFGVAALGAAVGIPWILLQRGEQRTVAFQPSLTSLRLRVTF